MRNFEEVMKGFQATLVSEARMHTCMEQVYYQTLHASYHSDSEINFKVLTDKVFVVIIQCGHCYNLVSRSGFLYANFNFYYHSIEILPGAVIPLKDNKLKMQEITPNIEQLKGRKLL